MSSNNVPTSSLQSKTPNFEQVRTRTEEVLGFRPCRWQVNACLAQLDKKDLIVISPTGSGKTATFWMPFLFEDTGIVLLVTPLKNLGEQQAGLREIGLLGIEATTVSAENSSDDLFKDIKDGRYRLIITSPELLTGDDPRFEALFEISSWSRNVRRVIFDEAHCVSRWSDFRPDYARACRLRYILPSDVKFYATSATLPEMDLDEVRKLLKIPTDPQKTTLIHRSNDRPNIAIGVRKLRHTQKSKHDLAFLIPPKMTATSAPPPSFMVFFQTKKETQDAWTYLRSRLPAELKDRVAYVHAGLTLEYRVRCLEDLKNQTIWGILCTDAAGMGIDIPNIDIVIQYKVPKDLCTLAQRFGRAARDPTRNGKALLFAEPTFFAEEPLKQKPILSKEKKEAKSKLPGIQVKQEQGKRKPAHAPETSPQSTPKSKRVRTDHPQLDHPTQSAAISVPTMAQTLIESEGLLVRSDSTSSLSSSESSEDLSDADEEQQPACKAS